MAFFVQVFRSTDLNAPPHSSQVGASLVVLNQCLVDGHGWAGMSISALTRTGAVATATVSAADGKKLKTGMILTFAGATGADASLYNITAAITVTSTTAFTYPLAGTPTGAATGTIVCDNFLRIVSITRGGTGNLTATVTTLNNNFSLLTGCRQTISGCTGTGAADYNITAQITVLSPNSFSYQMANDPGADASGAPQYARSGLQWTRPFAAGTNAQVFRSAATVGAMGEPYTARYCQVVDNAATPGGAIEAQIYGAEVMTADQVVISGRFPLQSSYPNGYCMRKSDGISAQNRQWTLWGDEKTFQFCTDTNEGAARLASGGSFGYFIPVKSGDAYNTFVAGRITFNDQNSANGSMFMSTIAVVPTNNNFGFSVARLYTQVGTSTLAHMTALYCTTSNTIGVSSNALFSPNKSDLAYYFQPLLIIDQANVLRGRMPGQHCPLFSPAFTQYDRLTDVVGLPGVTLLAVNVSSGTTDGQTFVDMFGPWT